MVAFFVSRASIREKTESLMDAEGTASVNQIAGWQSDNLTTLDTALDSMVYLKMDDEEILNYEAQFLGTYEDFPNGVYLSYDDGKVLDASGWEPEGKATETTWYQEDLGHDKFAFGDPYVDALTGSYLVMASRYVEKLNGKGAVAAADVSLVFSPRLCPAWKWPEMETHLSWMRRAESCSHTKMRSLWERKQRSAEIRSTRRFLRTFPREM